MGSASSISSVQLDAVKEQFLRKRAQGIPDEDMFNHMRKFLLELPREDCIVPPDLRIVTVNDVYELELLPNYATCRDRESKGAVKTIGTLPGDFLSPSLLSSLDKGKGMINCLNMAGIDYVCMGELIYHWLGDHLTLYWNTQASCCLFNKVLRASIVYRFY